MESPKGPENAANGRSGPEMPEGSEVRAEFEVRGEPESRSEGGRRRRDMPENLWMQCPDCSRLIYRPKVSEKLNVCPECNFHFEISSRQRIETMLDPGSFEEHFTSLFPLDPKKRATAIAPIDAPVTRNGTSTME